LGSWPLTMGPIGCPETSLRNHHDTLRNILRRAQISSASQRQSKITHDNGVISLRALRSDSTICLVSAGTASLKYRIYSKGPSSLTVTSVTAKYTRRNLLASAGVPWTLFECGSSEAKLRNYGNILTLQASYRIFNSPQHRQITHHNTSVTVRVATDGRQKGENKIQFKCSEFKMNGTPAHTLNPQSR
jgi:hypothetical protein